MTDIERLAELIEDAPWTDPVSLATWLIEAGVKLPAAHPENVCCKHPPARHGDKGCNECVCKITADAFARDALNAAEPPV